MNSFEKLNKRIREKKNYLCVGLDSDLSKIPLFFLQNSGVAKKDIEYFTGKDLTKLNTLLDFNSVIIELTKDITISYKINFAFYEQYGASGFKVIEKTLSLIPEEVFTIADAKRGDIGNTSKAYAKAVFETLNFDSVTVSPYMGSDSVSPFLEFEDKITFLLCLTSNPGSNDFQKLEVKIPDQEKNTINKQVFLYQYLMQKYSEQFRYQNIGFVVGATHPTEISDLREINQNSVFLIPGIGAQGGDLEQTLKANGDSPCLINVSRGIIYPESDSLENFKIRVNQISNNYADKISQICF